MKINGKGSQRRGEAEKKINEGKKICRKRIEGVEKKVGMTVKTI